MPYTKDNIPFVMGSDTSEQAAMEYAHVSGADRMRIYKCILQSPDGMTCDEIETLLEMRHQTVSARIRDLVLDGLIFDTEARRKTRSGRGARVYMAHKKSTRYIDA